VIRLVLLLLLLAPVQAANGHTFAPALLDIRERQPGIFDVIWRGPGKESAAAVPGDDALAPKLPPSCQRQAWLGSSETESEEWVTFRVDCGPRRLRGEPVAVSGIVGSRVDAIVRVTWTDGSAVTGVLRSDVDEFIVPDEAAGGPLRPGEPARLLMLAYLRLGIQHILLGVDHLLFVLGLLLIVKDRWTLVKTISSFTLAHSITLAIATLGYARAPEQPVNAAIALSILFLGPEIVRVWRGETSLTIRHPWVVAFVFGLLHGFGFATGLSTMGLSQAEIPLALLLFNGGVEIGQILFVTLVLLLERSFRVLEVRRWRLIEALPAYTVGTLGAYWTIQQMVVLLAGAP